MLYWNIEASEFITLQMLFSKKIAHFIWQYSLQQAILLPWCEWLLHKKYLLFVVKHVVYFRV